MSASVKYTDKLSAKQHKALDTLLHSPSVPEAAAAAGVTERTLYRWLAEDEVFIEAHRYARARAFEGAVSMLQYHLQEATDTLVRGMRCGVPTAEIRAAATLHQLALANHERIDLYAEIQKLKSAFESSQEDVWRSPGYPDYIGRNGDG